MTETTRTYLVSGMTCTHCVASVTEEVGAVPGVQSVAVELDSGRVVVSGPGVNDEAVQAAVAEAGYEVAA